MTYQIRHFSTDEILCIANDEGLLGKGTYGVVRLGFHDSLGTLAVKCSHMTGGRRQKLILEKKIQEEVELLQKANHDNVVRVLGWAHWSGSVALVMEYLPGGNLTDIITDKCVILAPLLLLRMCADTSNGIAFIHNLLADQRLVHGDIKPENILLTEDLRCKIADFAGAKLMAYTGGATSSTSKQYDNQFTDVFAAPELLKNPMSKLKPAHDTYSFGVTVLTLVGRQMPIQHNIPIHLYLEGIKRGQRPDLETVHNLKHELQRSGQNDDVTIIGILEEELKKCWQHDPNDRPTMLEIRNRLYGQLIRHDVAAIHKHVTDALQTIDITLPSRDKEMCVTLDRFHPPGFCKIEDDNLAIRLQMRLIKDNLQQDNVSEVISLTEQLVLLPNSKFTGDCDATFNDLMDIVTYFQDHGQCVKSIALLRWTSDLCGNILDSRAKLSKLKDCSKATNELAQSMSSDKDGIERSVLPFQQELLGKVKLVNADDLTHKAEVEAWCLYHIGLCYSYSDKYEQADVMCESAIKLMTSVFGRNARKRKVFAHSHFISAIANNAMNRCARAVAQLKQTQKLLATSEDINVEDRSKWISIVKELLEETTQREPSTVSKFFSNLFSVLFR